MQMVPIGRHQRAIRSFLDQRVLEAVLGLGPSTALTHQIQAHQVEQRLPHCTFLGADHGLQQ
jgi:hypothetical protein